MRKVTILAVFGLLIVSLSCNNNAGPGGGGGGWTSQLRTKYLKECVDEAGGAKQAREVCSCVIKKLERKFPNPADVETAGEELGERYARECMEAMSGGGGGDDFEDEDDAGNFNNKKKNSEFDDDDFDDGFGNQKGAGRWTSQERRSYIQGCAQARRQAAGVSAREANSYCECMTEKIERRYSFRDANRITAQDLQTREWQNAIAECSGGGGGFDNDDDY